MFFAKGQIFGQARIMETNSGPNEVKQLPARTDQLKRFDPLRRRLLHWQEVRSWARLITAAADLWYVEPRELKKLGALELDQLLREVPYSRRRRVNRWLIGYSSGTIFKS